MANTIYGEIEVIPLRIPKIKSSKRWGWVTPYASWQYCKNGSSCTYRRHIPHDASRRVRASRLKHKRPCLYCERCICAAHPLTIRCYLSIRYCIVVGTLHHACQASWKTSAKTWFLDEASLGVRGDRTSWRIYWRASRASFFDALRLVDGRTGSRCPSFLAGAPTQGSHILENTMIERDLFR